MFVKRTKIRMENLLNRLHPITLFFFGVAVIMVVLGILTNFQHKILHVLVVCGNVISGILWQWWYDSGRK